MMIIDATNMVVGRLSSYAAKQALLGENVAIVNCERAVISGSRKDVIAKYKQKVNRATVFKGPYIARMPDRFVRRIIRGMLPHKQGKGKDAFARIMCYISVPKEFEGKATSVPKGASAVDRQTRKYISVAELCKELGAKI